MRNDYIYEQLLEEWQNKYVGQDFVKDGIIHSDSWNKASCKTLFILKESYHKKGDTGNWDMRELGDYGKPICPKSPSPLFPYRQFPLFLRAALPFHIGAG